MATLGRLSVAELWPRRKLHSQRTSSFRCCVLVISARLRSLGVSLSVSCSADVSDGLLSVWIFLVSSELCASRGVVPRTVSACSGSSLLRIGTVCFGLYSFGELSLSQRLFVLWLRHVFVHEFDCIKSFPRWSLPLFVLSMALWSLSIALRVARTVIATSSRPEAPATTATYWSTSAEGCHRYKNRHWSRTLSRVIEEVHRQCDRTACGLRGV